MLGGPLGTHCGVELPGQAVPEDVEGAWLQQKLQPHGGLLRVHQPHDTGRQQGQASDGGSAELQEAAW